MLLSIVAISVGASLGALLRWVLGTQLNALFPSLPPGTLTANLLGCDLIGLAWRVAFGGVLIVGGALMIATGG